MHANRKEVMWLERLIKWIEFVIEHEELEERSRDDDYILGRLVALEQVKRIIEIFELGGDKDEE